jgi:hypothetical protein
MSRAAAAALVLTLSAAGTEAQDTGLITDRPDFTESPVVVPLGRVQIETGATWLRDQGASAFGAPETLVRWTFAPRLELRVVLPDYIDAEGVSGLGDAGLGAKIELGRRGGWTMGVIAGVSLPTGADGLGSDTVDPDVLLAAARDLTPAWSLGTQVTAAWRRTGDDLELGATLVVGTGLNARIGLFIELAASGVTGEPAAVVLHHGYTLALRPLMQLDVHAGAGLTDAAPGFLLGIGWSGQF